MKISLGEVATRKIEIELPHDGRVRTVRLEGLSGLSGSVSRGGSTFSLRPITALQATVAQIDWPLAAGQLSLDSPAAISQLAFEAELGTDGSGFHGVAQAGSVVARALRLVLGERRITADARARELRIEQTTAAGHAAAETLELGDLQSALGAVLIRWSRGVFERLRVDWGTGAALVGAATGAVNGLELTAAAAGVVAEAARVELPSGLRTSGRTVVLPEVVIPELVLSVADLTGLLGRRAPRPASESTSPRPVTEAGRTRAATDPGLPRRAPLDLGFLDRLGGRVEVDLTIELSLPVLGTRRKTHHFRVPIADGTFNYKQLERDLADLEDAFIDVEVRGKQLVIERRIPLIPGLERPLLLFDLDDREVELARKRLARLATIATVRRPARTDDGGRSSVQIRKLDFADIDVALSMNPGAAGSRDVVWGLGASRVAATGALRFAPGRVSEPTTGRVVIEGAATGAGSLGIGVLEVSLESLTIGRLEADLAMHGFVPRHTRIVAHDVRATGLKLAPRQVS